MKINYYMLSMVLLFSLTLRLTADPQRIIYLIPNDGDSGIEFLSTTNWVTGSSLEKNMKLVGDSYEIDVPAGNEVLEQFANYEYNPQKFFKYFFEDQQKTNETKVKELEELIRFAQYLEVEHFVKELKEYKKIIERKALHKAFFDEPIIY